MCVVLGGGVGASQTKRGPVPQHKPNKTGRRLKTLGRVGERACTDLASMGAGECPAHSRVLSKDGLNEVFSFLLCGTPGSMLYDLISHSSDRMPNHSYASR